MAIGYWLLAVSYWLLAVGYWLKKRPPKLVRRSFLLLAILFFF